MRHIPYRSQTGRIAIAETIFQLGSSTMEAVIANMPGNYHSRQKAAEASFKTMLAEGQLILTGDLYSLSPAVYAWAEDRAEKTAHDRQAEIVRAAEPPRFRPLSAKYMISATGSRDTEPAREFHPVSCGSNITANRVES